MLPRRQRRQARPPDETDSTTRKKRAQRRRERARAQELEGNNESNGWAPTTKKPKKPKEPKEPKETQNHTTQWPIVFVPEGQWRGRGGPPDRGRRGQRVLRGQMVSRGISRLRRQRRPFFFTRNGVFWDACWSWLGARPRTALWQTGGNGTHAVRTAVGRAVGRTAGQDCGTGGRPTGYSLYERQYSFRRQPEVTQRDKGVTTQTCFLPRGRRAQARSVGEGASPCQANLGVFHGRLLRRGVRAKGAGPSGRNKPAGFPLTLCLFVRPWFNKHICLYPITNANTRRNVVVLNYFTVLIDTLNMMIHRYTLW